MKNYKTFLFLGVIVLLVVLYLVLFKSIDPGLPFVQKTYNYLGSNDLGLCSGLINYQDKYVSYDDIINSDRLCNAYINIEPSFKREVVIDKNKKNGNCLVGEDILFTADNIDADMCYLEKISKEDLNNIYNKIYGYDISELDSFSVNDILFVIFM